MSVYSTIKKIAQDKRLSISAIEKDLGFSNGTISKWDSSIPRADKLQLVSDYLGVTSAYILNKSRNN